MKGIYISILLISIVLIIIPNSAFGESKAFYDAGTEDSKPTSHEKNINKETVCSPDESRYCQSDCPTNEEGTQRCENGQWSSCAKNRPCHMEGACPKVYVCKDGIVKSYKRLQMASGTDKKLSERCEVKNRGSGLKEHECSIGCLNTEVNANQVDWPSDLCKSPLGCSQVSKAKAISPSILLLNVFFVSLLIIRRKRRQH